MTHVLVALLGSALCKRRTSAAVMSGSHVKWLLARNRVMVRCVFRLDPDLDLVRAAGANTVMVDTPYAAAGYAAAGCASALMTRTATPRSSGGGASKRRTLTSTVQLRSRVRCMTSSSNAMNACVSGAAIARYAARHRRACAR